MQQVEIRFIGPKCGFCPS